MSACYDVAGLAARWGVSTTFVYDLIQARQLQAWRLGGKLWRIRSEAVEEYECRQTIALSPSHDGEPMVAPIEAIRSNGLTPRDRTASRLARLTVRPQKLALVHTGHREP